MVTPARERAPDRSDDARAENEKKGDGIRVMEP